MPLKTNEHRHQSNYDYRYDTGVWLGNLIRAGEHLLFINDGVYKVADIKRRDGSEQWSKEMCHAIAGSPSAPIPDSNHHELKAYVQRRHGSDAAPADIPTYVPNPDAVRQTRKMQILKSDVHTHTRTYRRMRGMSGSSGRREGPHALERMQNAHGGAHRSQRHRKITVGPCYVPNEESDC